MTNDTPKQGTPVEFIFSDDPQPYEDWDIVPQNHLLAEIMTFNDEETGVTTEYGVEMAKFVAKRDELEVCEMTIAGLVEHLLPNIERTSIKRFAEVDLTVPVLVSLNYTYLGELRMTVIDGWGRIQEAHAQGLTTVKAVLLPPENLAEYVISVNGGPPFGFYAGRVTRDEK